jgi:hypothetical protein
MTALRVLSAGFLATLLLAQPPTPAALSRSAQDVLIAVETNDFASAVDLAARLDDGVQQQLRAAAANGSQERLNEVLNLLPPDTETLLVLREPFMLNSSELAPPTPGHLPQVSLTERLASVANGRFFAALNGQTVRLAAAGLSNLRARSTSIPAVMPDADGAWFYFLGAPVSPGASINADAFGTPSELIGNRPVWRVTSRATRANESPRADESWVALVQPDLLVLATNRNILAGILARTSKPSALRALPAELTEWSQTDTNASAFGLRHYSAPEDRASGLTFAWNSTSHRVDIRYFTRANALPAFIARAIEKDFMIDTTGGTKDGIFKFSAQTGARGDYPVAVALSLLGFGSYR